MPNPPDNQNSPPTSFFDLLKGAIEHFSKLPPLLAYGGLLAVLIIAGLALFGVIPDALLWIPAIAIVAFLIYTYLEMQKERFKAQQEAEKSRLENELEKLKVQQEAERLRLENELERERLKQQTELEKAKLEALQPRPKEPEKPPPPAVWPQSYLAHIWHKCAQLHMTSIDPRAQELGASILNLQTVFTTLDVAATLEKKQVQSAQDIFDTQEAERHQRSSALAVLSRPENKKIVLLGQPGSGKSTLIKYLALCLSGEGLNELEAQETRLQNLLDQKWRLPALLPILVVLRDYAAKGLSQKQGLWAFITSNLEHDGLAACIEPLSQHLQNQGGILLLDGLDEVPEAEKRREQLRKTIIQFVSQFGKVRVVVTSRPYAYEKPDWQLPSFSQTTLLDFTPEQIESYVDRWYAVAAPQDPNLGKERAKQYANQLKRQIKLNSHLGKLAPRPLLLALMVSLHRWRGGGLLPERREQLYDASVNLLLDLWQRPKLILNETGESRTQEGNTLTELGIEALGLRRALSQLAYEVHRNQPNTTVTADISHEKLVAALRGAVPKEKRDSIPYKKIADYVRDRAGLLEDRGEEIYGFPHRTFQEYLAAMHLLNQEDFPQNIVDLARQDPDRWREATLLAGNSAQTTLQWALVEQLYERQDGPQNNHAIAIDESQWWGVFLAGQVLHDSGLLAEETKLYQGSLRQVQAWHKAILNGGVLPPRDRALAGKVLAALGDERPGVLGCDEMGFCYVPTGDFWLGSWQGGKAGSWYKGLDKPYWLAQYPVTVAQFREFVASSNYSPTYRGSLQGADNWPVAYMNWYDALAFCSWLEKRWQAKGWLPDGYRLTLPSEPEWEKAARGGKLIPATAHISTAANLKDVLNELPGSIKNALPQRQYPWGDAPEQEEQTDQGAIIYRANNKQAGIGDRCAVGSFPAGVSPHGCLDMSGQVWEWTRSVYEQYPARTTPESDMGGPHNSFSIVLRGGAYYREQNVCSVWNGDDPHYNFVVNDGFRLCVSPFLTSGL